MARSTTGKNEAAQTDEKSLRVDVPLATWEAADDLAQARTLDSIEVLLAAFAADLAEAAEWPETRGARAAWEWLEARYAPADWLQSRRAQIQKEAK